MFFYSLPILFHELNLITPSECFLISMIVAVTLYFSSPKPASETALVADENYLLLAWLGEVSLVNVFWPFFLMFNAIIFITDWSVKHAKITVSSWDDIHFVLLFPTVWWLVSVWRCSNYTRLAYWSALARFATLAVIAEYAIKLLIRVSYPRLFFDCEALLINYSSCF